MQLAVEEKDRVSVGLFSLHVQMAWIKFAVNRTSQQAAESWYHFSKLNAFCHVLWEM